MKSETTLPTENVVGVTHPRLVRLAWSAPAPPCEECRYDHTRAETPFGTFLLTWKGWKEYDSPGFDETPWGEVVYNGWNTVEEAQAWAESEMERRIKECLAHNDKVWDGGPRTPIPSETLPAALALAVSILAEQPNDSLSKSNVDVLARGESATSITPKPQ